MEIKMTLKLEETEDGIKLSRIKTVGNHTDSEVIRFTVEEMNHLRNLLEHNDNNMSISFTSERKR